MLVRSAPLLLSWSKVTLGACRSVPLTHDLLYVTAAAVLKYHAKINAIVDSTVVVDDTSLNNMCNAEMDVLSLCFEGNCKADILAFWED